MIRRIAFVFLLSIMLSTVSFAQDDLQSERFLLTFVPNVGPGLSRLCRLGRCSAGQDVANGSR